MNAVVRQMVTQQTYRLCYRTSYKYLQAPVISRCSVINRNYCDNKLETRRLPQLMEFPPVVWPSFINFIKNWMFSTFIIRPYFEQEFSLQEFIEASKHAVQVSFINFLYFLPVARPYIISVELFIFISQVVSEGLQNSDFKKLEGLVEKDAISTLKTAVSQLSISQRQLLSIDKEDIFYAFPYQVRSFF